MIKPAINEAITRTAAAVGSDAQGDSLDEWEGADCEERRLRCDLLRAQLQAADQKRRLQALVVERSVRRTDIALCIAAAVLLFQFITSPASFNAQLLVSLVALVGLASRTPTAVGKPRDG